MQIIPRVGSVTDVSSITPNIGLYDQYEVTALNQALTIHIPSGETPVDGQRLILRFKDAGSAEFLTWVTSTGGYRAVGITLPTTTVEGKVLYVGCIYNSQDSYYDCVATGQQ